MGGEACLGAVKREQQLIGGRTENNHRVTPDASKIHSLKIAWNLVKFVK